MQNPVFSGVAGGGLVMGAISFVLFQARALPGRVWSLLTNQFSVQMTVYSDQPAFLLLARWLSMHPSAARARRMVIQSWWSRIDRDTNQHAFSHGEGRHLIWVNRRPVLVVRSTTKSPNETGRFETITMTTIGRSQKPFRKILDALGSIETDKTIVEVNIHGSGNVIRRAKRPINTIYMDSLSKEEIIADIEKFLKSRELYASRGIPWRRGYMLSGPPGTGKSSLILALASHFEKSLYIVNPSVIKNDNGLHSALNNAHEFVVIEDIDSVNVLKARPNLEQPKKEPESDDDDDALKSEIASTGITMSGFLNAVDGIGTGEGRVLFLTSNTPDALDPAVLRPGRIDRHYIIGLASEQQAKDMFLTFFPDRDPSGFLDEIRPQLPMSCARLQDMILAME